MTYTCPPENRRERLLMEGESVVTPLLILLVLEERSH